MSIQCKRCYGPQYTVHNNTFFSPHLKGTSGIKIPIEDELNQLELTLWFVSDLHIVSFSIGVVERGLP